MFKVGDKVKLKPDEKYSHLNYDEVYTISHTEGCFIFVDKECIKCQNLNDPAEHDYGCGGWMHYRFQLAGEK